LLANVVITLKGTDNQNNAVVLTTTTDASGNYSFNNLKSGTYRIIQSQPTGYKDGPDSIGSHGGFLGENPGPFVIPNDVTTDQVKDLFIGIQLDSGVDATDYDFRELAVPSSKRSYISY
jgi:hypothetical protein